MERMLAVVFNNESQAYEGSRALKQLDAEGSIAVYAAQVIQKNADGTVSAKQTDGNFPVGTMEGMWIGSLIGVLGGPAGVGIGAAVGSSAGAIGDLNVADLNADFVEEVSALLVPGKCALVADISEEWVTPVDTRMEALGGTVFRTAREHFEAEQRARDVAKLRGEIDGLKAEHAREQGERKAKLQSKIDALNTKLQGKVTDAKRRLEQFQKENQAMMQSLQKKATDAQGDAKAAMESRIAEIKNEYNQSTANLRKLAS